MKKIIIGIGVILSLSSCQDNSLSALENRVKQLELRNSPGSGSKTDIKIDSIVNEYKKNLREIRNL